MSIKDTQPNKKNIKDKRDKTLSYNSDIKHKTG